jgi:hypothetical protein
MSSITIFVVIGFILWLPLAYLIVEYFKTSSAELKIMCDISYFLFKCFNILNHTLENEEIIIILFDICK